MSQKATELNKSPKKRDRAQSEQQLINAAIAIFSKHGYNGSSTRMIAAKAKVNESLIARYFGGKEGIMLAVVERFVSEHCSEELNYPPQETFYQELCCYLENKLTSNQDRIPLAKIIISHSLTDPKFHKKALTRVPMLEDEKFMERLRLLVSKNQIAKNENLNELFSSIDNYLHGVFLFEFLLNQTPVEDILKITKVFAKLCADGIKSRL